MGKRHHGRFDMMLELPTSSSCTILHFAAMLLVLILFTSETTMTVTAAAVGNYTNTSSLSSSLSESYTSTVSPPPTPTSSSTATRAASRTLTPAASRSQSSSMAATPTSTAARTESKEETATRDRTPSHEATETVQPKVWGLTNSTTYFEAPVVSRTKAPTRTLERTVTPGPPTPEPVVYDVPGAPSVKNEAVAAAIGAAIGVVVIVLFVCIVHYVLRQRAPEIRTHSSYEEAARAAEEGHAGDHSEGDEEMRHHRRSRSRDAEASPHDDAGGDSQPPRRLYGPVEHTPTHEVGGVDYDEGMHDDGGGGGGGGRGQQQQNATRQGSSRRSPADYGLDRPESNGARYDDGDDVLGNGRGGGGGGRNRTPPTQQYHRGAYVGLDDVELTPSRPDPGDTPRRSPPPTASLLSHGTPGRRDEFD